MKLSPSGSNIAIFQIASGDDLEQLRQSLADARREIGHRDEVFSSAESLTVIIWPDVRSVSSAECLMSSSAQINSILQKTRCTVHKPNQLAAYLTDGSITSLERAHLVEHLSLPFLRLAQKTPKAIDADTGELQDGLVVTVLTGGFDQAVLADILLFFWHRLTLSLKGSDFPGYEQVLRAVKARADLLLA